MTLVPGLVAIGLAVQLAGPDGRTLSGIVEDSSGGAIPGARVAVSCDGDTRRVSTDGGGLFRVASLAAAKCRVVAEHEFFSPTVLDVDLGSRSSAYVRLVLDLEGFATEVVVTPARGDGEQAFEVPESVAVTTREELEARPLQVLPQALREEPGVLVQQTSTAQASVFIRGFSAQRVVYLIDGVRFNTSTFRTGATQYLGWVNPGLVQQLEVVRGPASVQYGSDALGGAVNVISQEPPFSPSGWHLGGSLEGLASTADLGGGADLSLLIQGRRAALRAGGSARRIGDLRPGRGRDSHAAVTRFLGLPSSAIGTRLGETGFVQGGGYVTGRFSVGPSAELRAIYMHEEQAGVTRYDRVLGGDGLHRSEFDPQRLDFGSLSYERSDAGPLGRAALTFSFNRQQDDRVEQARPTSRVERERGRVLALGYQGQVSRSAGPHSLVMGGEFYDEYIATARVLEDPVTGAAQEVRPEIPDGARYSSLGLYVQDAWTLSSRLSLRGGLRLGRFTFRTDADDRFGVADERVTSSAATFHTGGVVGLTRWLNATFTASRGFRAANALDLGAIGISGGGFELAPAEAAALGAVIGSNDGAAAVSTGRAVGALGPESLYAFEAGVKLRTRRLSGSATMFDLELVDAIQRRTALFSEPIVGTVIAGFEVVRQDEQGRAFIAADPRPIVTRVNVERARIRGLEMDAQLRLARAWLIAANFSMANGRDRSSGEFLRRMPPPLGTIRVKWEPSTHSFWMEGAVSYALRQSRLSPGDLGDARIGGRRTRATIGQFFTGTATDLGLVSEGRLVATGETLAQVQDRVLGTAPAAPLFTSTPGFVVLGLRSGWQIRPDLSLTFIAENLTDRNYRWHGSGVDSPGINLQIKARYGF